MKGAREEAGRSARAPKCRGDKSQPGAKEGTPRRLPSPERGSRTDGVAPRVALPFARTGRDADEQGASVVSVAK